MSKIKDGRIHFDRNGVASVDAEELLRDRKVKEQYEAARRIVEKHRVSAKRARVGRYNTRRG